MTVYSTEPGSYWAWKKITLIDLAVLDPLYNSMKTALWGHGVRDYWREKRRKNQLTVEKIIIEAWKMNFTLKEKKEGWINWTLKNNWGWTSNFTLRTKLWDQSSERWEKTGGVNQLNGEENKRKAGWANWTCEVNERDRGANALKVEGGRKK